MAVGGTEFGADGWREGVRAYRDMPPRALRAMRVSPDPQRIQSKAKFAMGAEANRIEMVGVGFAVDQNQIGPNVAVAVVLP